MDERELSRRLAAVLSDVRALAAGEDTTLVTGFADVQRARAGRLAAARGRLTDAQGEDHPDVAALTRRVEAANRFSRRAEDLVEGHRRAPRVRPNELVVSAEVVDRDGRPLPGVRVRLYDRDVTQDDLLGDERSDASGIVHFVFHERDYHERGEGQPELYVVVDAPDGRRLADTREQAVAESGVVRLLRVEVSGVSRHDVAPDPTSTEPQRCAATTAKGHRCKQRARPGSRFCGRHANAGQ